MGRRSRSQRLIAASSNVLQHVPHLEDELHLTPLSILCCHDLILRGPDLVLRRLQLSHILLPSMMDSKVR